MLSFYHLESIEFLHKKYLENRDYVDPSWMGFFEGWELGFNHRSASIREPDSALFSMIQIFRTHGHLYGNCNPIESASKKIYSLLEQEKIPIEDLEREVPTFGILPQAKAPLRALLQALEEMYCASIGFEYVGICSEEEEAFLNERIPSLSRKVFSKEECITIFTDLCRTEFLEIFLHTKYVGQTRFSLQGAESFIPMMHEILNQAAKQGVKKVIMGMAHRGRLNVLAHILNKSYGAIFEEFEDHYTADEEEGSGDVKYHMGFSAEISTKEGRQISIILCANPSHLESIDPVVEGVARAICDKEQLKEEEILPILIHGDASLSGQGVVYETLQMSGLKGYTAGGTLHVVINNQIGYTTLPSDGRSTTYCTDIAKAFSLPIFHVNGEDSEAIHRVATLAEEFRQKFGKDAFIDLLCYRLYGHNEGDEPSFTQPLEYKVIRSKKSIKELYKEELTKRGLLTLQETQEIETQCQERFKEGLPSEKNIENNTSLEESVQTGVSRKRMESILEELGRVPQGFTLHPKLQRLFQERKEMFGQDGIKKTVDWATAEALCFATLLEDGASVRISGQDVCRGTFAHRHALLVDQNEKMSYVPLEHLTNRKAPFFIGNSFLSEFAVLGFEFGYSTMIEKGLVIWEAQYGDFANSAQVIIDQYIVSAEQKWGIQSALTLFLPHGYTGQGPEHSSARIERFLQLAAENNLRIANVTTPEQLFHLLRLQGLSSKRKPLILFTPKALLRHPLVVSAPMELEQGQFMGVLDDPLAPYQAEHLIFCSGQIYYELLAEREKRGLSSSYAYIRIELLYPFDENAIVSILQKYGKAKKVFWVQEEPENMGAYTFMKPLLEKLLPQGKLGYVGRKKSASTASGSHKLHKKQHIALMTQLFGENK